MITVTVKIMGRAQPEVIEDFSGTTVQELMNRLNLAGNYTINIGGVPAQTTSTLVFGSYVVFAPSVKGA
jgi:hypothetical protein